ncbi:MAG: Asp-tRNA(Asn)/Glu-tRNA(Gln) amidotransferase subunit GatC [Sulfuricurvum sp.]|uniref:Asp-tRNA(Asn)/Glu-tRNA(Gln) amidotransferase subunit GatC n=1 Tax=Sulfuricurvum sp. TaxID=2025608 RepID=UPI003567082F
MQIDETLLQRLEKLSYLEISQEHRKEMIVQLSEIVSFVDNLTELDTDGVEATFAMSDVSTRLRDDVGIVERSINDDILAHAPHSQEHFFIVPKIIE